VKYPLFFSGVNRTRNFRTDFRKVLKQTFMTISPVWPSFSSYRRKDRQTGRHDEANGLSWQFCESA